MENLLWCILFSMMKVFTFTIFSKMFIQIWEYSSIKATAISKAAIVPWLLSTPDFYFIMTCYPLEFLWSDGKWLDFSLLFFWKLIKTMKIVFLIRHTNLLYIYMQHLMLYEIPVYVGVLRIYLTANLSISNNLICQFSCLMSRRQCILSPVLFDFASVKAVYIRNIIFLTRLVKNFKIVLIDEGWFRSESANVKGGVLWKY